MCTQNTKYVYPNVQLNVLLRRSVAFETRFVFLFVGLKYVEC